MDSKECFANAREMDALAVRYPELSGEYSDLARIWRAGGRVIALDEESDLRVPLASNYPIHDLWGKSTKAANSAPCDFSDDAMVETPEIKRPPQV